MVLISLLSLVMVTYLWIDSERPSTLDRIRDNGTLQVLTRVSSTTYEPARPMLRGLEYELARRFAARLGVALELVEVEGRNRLIPALRAGRGDLAAAGLAVTPRRKRLVRFGPSYQTVTEQVVHRRGDARPGALDDLGNYPLEVAAGSSPAQRLTGLDADWIANPDLTSAELMELVAGHIVDYTVAQSHKVAIHRRLHPELGVGPDLGDPRQLAWAFRQGNDDSLIEAARRFFGQLQADGTLAQLRDRYYGYLGRHGYVDLRSFHRHRRHRLPRYRPLFAQAARRFDLDWRLLAAVSYQESHWQADARSPTGVRGLMMLTRATASQLEVGDRLDPCQSVRGGAQYLTVVEAKLPRRIPEPDRTWLALAAYNIGFGHLEDARILTQRQGGDPDRWLDVKQRLPLLDEEAWYRTTRYGQARGKGAVHYVENIRSYYDMLVRLTSEPTPAVGQRRQARLTGAPTPPAL